MEIVKNESPGLSISEEGNEGVRWITLRVLVSGEPCFVMFALAMNLLGSSNPVLLQVFYAILHRYL